MTSDAVHYVSLIEVSGGLRRGELIGSRAIQSSIDLRKRWLPGGAATASMRAEGSKRSDACRGSQFSTPAVDRGHGKLPALIETPRCGLLSKGKIICVFWLLEPGRPADISADAWPRPDGR